MLGADPNAADLLAHRVVGRRKFPAPSARSSPRIALSGVLSSCDMIARKSDLAWLAASASSRASRSCASWRARSSARLRSVMSRRETSSTPRLPIGLDDAKLGIHEIRRHLDGRSPFRRFAGDERGSEWCANELVRRLTVEERAGRRIREVECSPLRSTITMPSGRLSIMGRNRSHWPSAAPPPAAPLTPVSARCRHVATMALRCGHVATGGGGDGAKIRCSSGRRSSSMAQVMQPTGLSASLLSLRNALPWSRLLIQAHFTSRRNPVQVPAEAVRHGRELAHSSAIANLRRICEQELAGRYELEIIDVLEHPAARRGREDPRDADADQGAAPCRLRRVIGDLSDTEKVLLGLEVQPASR